MSVSRLSALAALLAIVGLARAEEVPTSRVDPAVLKAIVKVTAECPTRGTSLGTGFILSRPRHDGSADRRFYLITNKHMLGDWTVFDGDIAQYCSTLEVAFYGGSAGHPTTPVMLPIIDKNGALHRYIHLHSDRSIDVAAIALDDAVPTFNALAQASFDPSATLSFDRIARFLTGLGDQVFALGYPRGITSLTSSYPIAKAGYLATQPGEPFAIELHGKNRAGKVVTTTLAGKLLVVDGLLVPGNSGGPVVLPSDLRVRRDPSTGQLQFATEQLKNYVVGIVSQGLDGSGLTLVYSADYIWQVVDDLEKQSKQ